MVKCREQGWNLEAGGGEACLFLDKPCAQGRAAAAGRQEPVRPREGRMSCLFPVPAHSSRSLVSRDVSPAAPELISCCMHQPGHTGWSSSETLSYQLQVTWTGSLPLSGIPLTCGHSSRPPGPYPRVRSDTILVTMARRISL